jgi:ribose 5-phosphate isomerase
MCKPLVYFPNPLKVHHLTGWKHAQRKIETGYNIEIKVTRKGRKNHFITDQKHYILDCYFKQPSPRPEAKLNIRTGISSLVWYSKPGLFVLSAMATQN